MESALSWTCTNVNRHSFTVLFYIDSKSLCEALISSHPRTFPSVPSHLQSLSSGSLAIHLFQATISQTKQQKQPPTLLQMHHFPYLYLAPFKSLTKRFVTHHKHTNELLLSIDFEVFIETSNRLPTEEMTFSLLAYGLIITLLYSNTSIVSILLKIQFARIAKKKNKISFTGSATVQLCHT